MPASRTSMSAPAKDPDLVNEIGFFQIGIFVASAKISFKKLNLCNENYFMDHVPAAAGCNL
jgi:hypothetical protein